jgi:hypothetical protein
MSSLIFSREHPLYALQKESWKRTQKAYAGGRAYIDVALLRHVSEAAIEFDERKARVHYFNYPRRVARLITQYVMAVSPERHNAAPEAVEDWSRSGLRTNEVIRQLSTFVNLYGLGWLSVDMPRINGEITLAAKQAGRIRPYVTAVQPLQVVDWSHGADGRLAWAIIEDIDRADEDPFAERKTIVQRRLWTRDSWTVFEKSLDGGAPREIATGRHQLGAVPLVCVYEPDGYGVSTEHWFNDVVRVSDSILNAESELQMNILKQMFGLLVVPDSFFLRATERVERMAVETGASIDETYAMVLARSTAITETAEESGISRYIAPPADLAETIRSEIGNLRAALYEVVGLSLSKDTRDVESAEAKAWDFHAVAQYLASRSDMLEQAEVAAWALMNQWDPSIPLPEVAYNRDFKVADLKADVESLIGLSSIPTGEEYTKEVEQTAVELLSRLRPMSPERRQELADEIANRERTAPTPEMDLGGVDEDEEDEEEDEEDEE